MKYLLPIIIIVSLLFASCSFQEEGVESTTSSTQESAPQIANPASEFCIENGNRLEIRTVFDGSQVGFCVFPDDSYCEEWAYFRGECPLDSLDDVNSDLTNVEKDLTIIPPLKIPNDIKSNCFGFLIGTPEEALTARAAGAGFVRPHPGPFVWGYIENEKGVYDFTAADEYVLSAQSNNVTILGTIWPFMDSDQLMCHDVTCAVSRSDQFFPRSSMEPGSIPEYRCAPCDNNDYILFVTRLVERYDGDGVDDMPGLLIPVNYWEVLNEPEMESSDLTFYKGSKTEYVSILRSTYGAVKFSCSDCVVLQGGAAGSDNWSLNYWKEVYSLGASDYVDLLNIHYINHGDISSLNVKPFTEALPDVSRPIWVTEAEFQSESEVYDAVKGSFDSGASKIFFTRFVVGEKEPPEPGKYSPVYDKVRELCKP